LKLKLLRLLLPLKSAIKKEMSVDFAAYNLDLWLVSLPIDSYLPKNVEELKLTEDQRLKPAVRLRKVFTSLPADDHVHIVVERPPDCKYECFDSAPLC
jgi:hypothetical protein